MSAHCSFIIPVLGQEAQTLDCLISLEATVDLDRHELIVVYNGDDDAFLRRLKGQVRRWPHNQLLASESIYSYAENNNQAAEIAKGSMLAMINNDLVLRRGWLKPMLTLFEDFPDTGCAGNLQIRAADGRLDHAGKYFDQQGLPEHFDFRQVHWPATPDREHGVFPMVTAACMLVRKGDFDALGGFDTDYRNGFEDDDLALRLAEERKRQHRVSFLSSVYHHVSQTPGRKDHESEGRNRFRSRWQDFGKAWYEKSFRDCQTQITHWAPLPWQSLHPYNFAST